MAKHKYIETPEIKRPDFEFELPLKKVNGFYKPFPNRNHIGGKNTLRRSAEKKVKVGYVYLIKIKGIQYFKIGVSSNPSRRLSDLSSVIPFELELLALNQVDNPYKVESDIIEFYKHKLIKNEWFKLSMIEAREIMILLHNTQVEDSIIMN